MTDPTGKVSVTGYDPELDDLLDGALDDFQINAEQPLTTPSIQLKAANTTGLPQPPTSQPTALSSEPNEAFTPDFEAEFARQFTQGMEELLEQVDGNDEGLKSTMEQLLQSFHTLGMDLPSTLPDTKSGSATAERAASLRPDQPSLFTSQFSPKTAPQTPDPELRQPQSFQDRIRSTIGKLDNSADQANADLSEANGEGGEDSADNLLKGMMDQLEHLVDGQDFEGMMESILEQVMTKDVLYEPMQELARKYPDWLAARKESLPAAEYNQYAKQLRYIEQIVAFYDAPDYDRVSQTDQGQKKIVELMKEMQDCGQPPKELLKEIAPDMDVDDSSGMPKLPGAGDCTIMLGEYRKRTRQLKKRTKRAIRSVTSIISSGPLLHGRKVIELQEQTRRTDRLECHLQKLKAKLQQGQDDLAQRRAQLATYRAHLNAAIARFNQTNSTNQASSDLPESAPPAGKARSSQRQPPSQPSPTSDSPPVLANISHPAHLSTDASLTTPIDRVATAIDHAQRLLAAELLFIFDLKLIHVRTSSPFVNQEDCNVTHINGLIWPTNDEWHKFPADYVNACVETVLLLLKVLSQYHDHSLPFGFQYRGAADSVTFPNWVHRNSSAVPLYMTDHHLERFIVGLAMVNYNVVYLCNLYQLSVSPTMVTQAAANLRAFCLQARPLDRPISHPAPTAMPYSFYKVVRLTLSLYRSDPHIESKVMNYLRSLHYCDVDIDWHQYQREEKWDIIDNQGDSMEAGETSP
ncbi:Peroxisome chaperone and import receptor [Dimargaris xerosporica]|nr:Peroxisome chaperone and import receptor [Dimargaris xerosporica]